MICRNLFYFFLIILLCLSCSKKDIEKSTISEINLESQMIEAYKEGIKELKAGDVRFAAKKFNEAEILFPQSEYAPKSALMAADMRFKPILADRFLQTQRNMGRAARFARGADSSCVPFINAWTKK